MNRRGFFRWIMAIKYNLLAKMSNQKIYCVNEGEFIAVVLLFVGEKRA